jgi:hypothetical protein
MQAGATAIFNKLGASALRENFKHLDCLQRNESRTK